MKVSVNWSDNEFGACLSKRGRNWSELELISTVLKLGACLKLHVSQFTEPWEFKLLNFVSI